MCSLATGTQFTCFTSRKVQILTHLMRGGHSSVVTNVAFSSDSSRICSASLDHSVRLNLLAFTSTNVQTLTQTLQVRIWDAERGGKENAMFTDSAEIRACCFSPDGGFVVAI